MSLRRVLTIFTKDLRDSMRDGRVVVMLLMPIAIAVLFNLTATEPGERPKSDVVVVDPDGTGLGEALKEATDRTVDVTVGEADTADAARRSVVSGDEDVGIIAGPQAVDKLKVLLPEDAGATAQTVAAAADAIAASRSGRAPTSNVDVETVELDRAEEKPIQIVEMRVVMIAISIIMMVALVAFFTVPMQTAEELETGTFAALRLAATGPEILAAKTLGGLLLGVAGTVLILAITRLPIADPPLLIVATLLLVLSIVAFGLLLGLVVRNVNAISTYGIFLIFPVLGAAFAVMIVTSGPAMILLDALPFSQGMKLLINGLVPEQPFDLGPVTWIVILAWTVLGFAFLGRYAARREV